jgi:hypothetical protein
MFPNSISTHFVLETIRITYISNISLKNQYVLLKKTTQIELVTHLRFKYRSIRTTKYQHLLLNVSMIPCYHSNFFSGAN